MSGISVGGPTPAAVTTSAPADSAGKQAVAQARQAAVAAVKDERQRDDREQPPAAYGVKGSVSAQEASARYDARGKVAEEQEERGRKFDRRA